MEIYKSQVMPLVPPYRSQNIANYGENRAMPKKSIYMIHNELNGNRSSYIPYYSNGARALYNSNSMQNQLLHIPRNDEIDNWPCSIVNLPNAVQEEDDQNSPITTTST